MADELQTGICGGNWWNSSRSALGTSQCSSFGWSTDVVVDMMKVRSTCDEDDQSANSVCDNSSMVFRDIHQKTQPVDSGSGGGLMDSTLQMLGFGLSPSSATTSDWNNQTLLRSSERTESNYHSVLQEEDMSSRLNYRQESGMDCHQIQSDWTSKNFAGGDEDSTIDAFKTMNQNFSQGSASYGYPSSLVQSLFEPEPQTQQTPFDNSRSMNYQPAANFREEFSPSWPKISQILKPSMPKQQPTSNHLHFSNNTPFWNASAAALNDIRTSFLASDQFLSTTFQEKPNCANLTTKHNPEEVRDSRSLVKKSSSEPTFKRPRIETPSPLPTFKVRKEKLGDRITALQQLVSPFGKTDTASVLHEAIEYIKFLHDQVSVLSTPYMKNGAPNGQHQQISDKLKDSEMPKQDLRSRGLCLVPVSSTYPVASETTADFWTPTFGGTFR